MGPCAGGSCQCSYDSLWDTAERKYLLELEEVRSILNKINGSSGSGSGGRSSSLAYKKIKTK